jgi:MATE family multidrug resistance protein
LFICSLEVWYYRVLVLLTGYLKNAEIAVDALSIWYLAVGTSVSISIQICSHANVTEMSNYLCNCSLTINGWELMIPLGFLAATG